ncbi:unnamed protein product [Schistosoma rodhaini]|uniref:phosphopyruvate hydratase n=2 Tax=Schistosoma rodhaini TaxID=6188 RepID=A0AA85G823_9TREM|nr:unnamed protein product [Schistosoma rodhaini]
MDIKTRAIEYFSNNNILKELENALQLMFQENESDHFGYLSKYFEQISLTPKVVSIKVDESYSCIGTSSSSLSVFTLWRTKTEVITRVNYIYGCNNCLSYGNILNKSTPSEFSVCVDSVLDLLNNCLWSPLEMIEVDKYIRNFYDEYRKQFNTMQSNESKSELEDICSKEVPLKSTTPQNAKKKSTKDVVTLIPNQLILLAPLIATDLTWLSMSLHLTAMKCSPTMNNFQAYMKSLYEEVIQSIISEKGSTNSSIPSHQNHFNKITCPIITIFNCSECTGGLSSGKCRFLKEILLVPKPYLTPKQLLSSIFIIKTKLSQILIKKSNLNPQLICDNGASSVMIDKPEQIIDLLIELLDICQLNNEFYIGLYILPKRIFDTVKERYEIITGTLKTPEELVNYYIDLLGKYPQIRLLIDPFRAEDKQCWDSLNSRITTSIFITTSTIIQPAIKEITPNRSNSVTMKNSTTINSTFNEPLKFSIPTGLTIYELMNCQQTIMQNHSDNVNTIEVATTDNITNTTTSTTNTTIGTADTTTSSSSTTTINATNTIITANTTTSTTSTTNTITTTTTDNNNDSIQIQTNSLQSISFNNTIDRYDLCYSSWLFTMDTCLDCVLITELIQAIHQLHLQNRQVIFSLDNLQVIEDWPIDMAIGLGIDFIKLTGLNRIDQMNKLITWYNYYQNIIDQNHLMTDWKLYDLSIIDNS